MPAIAVGTARIAAQPPSFLTMSFCRAAESRRLASNAAVEYMPLLDSFELFSDPVDGREVIIADAVENSVHDSALAQTQQIRVTLAALSHFGVGGRCTVPDRDDKTLADDQMRLAVLDTVAVKLSGPQTR
jgi:hypothetical protein